MLSGCPLQLVLGPAFVQLSFGSHLDWCHWADGGTHCPPKLAFWTTKFSVDFFLYVTVCFTKSSTFTIWCYILFFYCTQIYKLPEYKLGARFPLGKDWSCAPWGRRTYIPNREPCCNRWDWASDINLKWCPWIEGWAGECLRIHTVWTWVPFTWLVPGCFHTGRMHCTEAEFCWLSLGGFTGLQSNLFGRLRRK